MIPYTKTSVAIKGYGDSKLAKSERGDCVVRAIASAYDIEYDGAHSWVAKTFGRKPKSGTYGFPNGMNRMSQNGDKLNRKVVKTLTESDLKGRGVGNMTVGSFAKLYDRGTYIIRVPHHAFTIKDGVVIGNPQDSTRVKRIIKNAWKIG